MDICYDTLHVVIVGIMQVIVKVLQVDGNMYKIWQSIGGHMLGLRMDCLCGE